MSDSMSTDEWLITELLRHPRLGFVLWAVAMQRYDSVELFQQGFGDELEITELAEELEINELITVHGGQLEPTSRGLSIAETLTRLSISEASRNSLAESEGRANDQRGDLSWESKWL